jgi:ATP-dependent RNA helicase DDX1
LCRVGWAMPSATPELGTDSKSLWKYFDNKYQIWIIGVGFGGTGKFSFNRQFDTYGEPFGVNDVIGCYVDFNASTLHFSKNGVLFLFNW